MRDDNQPFSRKRRSYCNSSRTDHRALRVGRSKAAAAQARGSLELANREFEKGASSLRRALELWLEVDLPYEAAMTRLLLGQVYNGTGDVASADLELRAARSAFEKLGAQAAVHEFDTLMSTG